MRPVNFIIHDMSNEFLRLANRITHEGMEELRKSTISTLSTLSNENRLILWFDNSEIYSDEEKWKLGAQQFSQFFAAIYNDKFQNLDLERHDLEDIAGLQTLFLREKPAVWIGFCYGGKNKVQLTNASEFFGFRYHKDIIFDPVQVQFTIKKYSNIFGNETIDDLIAEFFKHDRDRDDLKLGLVLGFPLEACKGFKAFSDEKIKVEQLGRTLFKNLATFKGIKYEDEDKAYDRLFGLIDDLKSIHNILNIFEQCCNLGIVNDLSLANPIWEASRLRNTGMDNLKKRSKKYGLNFIPYVMGEETRILDERLERAYLTSGILKVIDTQQNDFMTGRTCEDALDMCV